MPRYILFRIIATLVGFSIGLWLLILTSASASSDASYIPKAYPVHIPAWKLSGQRPTLRVTTTTVKPSKRVSQKPVRGSSVSDPKIFIYLKESGNNPASINKHSGACGLGQSLPCSKLSNVCPDWPINYECQDRFFTAYMMARYKTWEAAYQFWQKSHWW